MTTETKDPLDQLPWDDDTPPGVEPTPAEVAAGMTDQQIAFVRGETDDPGEPPTEQPVKKTRKPRTKKEGTVTEAISGDVLPAEVEAEERSLVTIQPSAVARADHHIVTGMAALARMTDSEFENTMLSIEQGQRRMREFQERAMTAGEDYGKVKGIERPFLHLPGAEKLCLLYGLAARQEAERVVGRRSRISVAGIEQDGEWLSPPLAYHVKTYMHLGNFDGPVVAMGYGESNSWEVKYRYVFRKPLCERCGHELMKGGSEGKMAGKWFCPGFKGGCWWSTDVANVPPAEKIENPDPHSLAETLIQMAAKRSLVAGTRRATGTSGLFTQDEDSPSVEAQAGNADDGSDAPPPEVEKVDVKQEVARGGKAEKPTQEQITRLAQLSREKELGPVNLAVYFHRVTNIPVHFGDVTDRAQQSMIFLTALQTATADQVGQLIHTIETGEVEPEATPGEPPQDS